MRCRVVGHLCVLEGRAGLRRQEPCLLHTNWSDLGKQGNRALLLVMNGLSLDMYHDKEA